MTTSHRSRVGLELLLDEAPYELDALGTQSDKVRDWAPRLREPTPDPGAPALVAVALHAWYTAAEELFGRIARHVDGHVPAGDRSHRDLLDQMRTPLTDLRPAVISRELRSELGELLKFRHFFRHPYAVDLEAEELLRNVARLERAHPQLLPAMESLLDFARRTRDALLEAEESRPGSDRG